MLNHADLMGRLVADPELKTSRNGRSVTTFTLAVERDYKTEDGQRKPDFIDIVAWNKTAEFVCRYFRKGQLMVVSGRIQNREYEDRNGRKRIAFEIVADAAYFGGSKNEGGNYTPEAETASQASTGNSMAVEVDDDELPF